MERHYVNFGGQSSHRQPFYVSDQFPHQFATSQQNYEYPSNQEVQNSSQYNFVMPTQPLPSPTQAYSRTAGGDDQDIEEVRRPTTKRKGKEKEVPRRGSNFSKEEDVVLCSAWLNVSIDPIIGAGQSQGGFYKRMHEYFNANKPPGSTRSQNAIQNRWLLIQKCVNKFCGIKSAIDRRHESGKNEADRIEDAINMYERKEPFQFLHCWKILRDQAKWNDKLLELNNNGGKNNEANVAEPGCEGELPSESNVHDRPEGRDTAKRRSRRESESSGSAAFEVLQRIHDNREKSQLKEEEQLQQILNRKDEKLNLQRAVLKVQMDAIELKKQAREEDVLLRKQEHELLAKQTEAQLLTAEAGIMAVDLEKVAPHLKEYYIGMQRQIMERRGFGSSSSNNP